MFKFNLNEISRGRNKSWEQKGALENIKLLYKSREAVFKLFYDYSSIISEAKYKPIHGCSKYVSKHILSMNSKHVSAGTKVTNCKVSGHSNLKMLSPKQMLQRLPIALAQVKVGNTSWNLLNEIRQIIHYWYIFYW